MKSAKNFSEKREFNTLQEAKNAIADAILSVRVLGEYPLQVETTLKRLAHWVIQVEVGKNDRSQ